MPKKYLLPLTLASLSLALTILPAQALEIQADAPEVSSNITQDSPSLFSGHFSQTLTQIFHHLQDRSSPSDTEISQIQEDSQAETSLFLGDSSLENPAYRSWLAQEMVPEVLATGSTFGQQISDYTLHFVGFPYVSGQSTTDGFDCAGLASYVYTALGHPLDHSLFLQFYAGNTVRRTQLQPGDLLFFGSIAHVGIYVGDGLFVHAANEDDGVILSSLEEERYHLGYLMAKRVIS